MSLSAVRISSKSKPATAAVIFLHGLGDSGAGWSFLSDYARASKEFDHIKFIFPNAPSQPVTVNGGMRCPSWFDIYELGNNKNINLGDDKEGFLKSIDTIREHIKELNNSDIPTDRVIIGGFSQGAALSLASSVLVDEKLAGVIGLSGFARIVSTLKEKIASFDGVKNLPNVDTPVLQCHGLLDEVINYEFGAMTKDFFKKEIGLTNYKFYKFNNLGHSCNEDEISLVLNFIKDNLPSTTK
ncbi:palmitoyl-(protein) hydrolase [Ascoidea rubescens DSM 1968]|uniref:Acyl-protein thioesterase 1 n=1 Tax=Ascoidea rubescens DSM 1968 TaxID=1344418 RepID=A0A1D2VC92_9ASCO|nr:Phospholipase/carboxylesterase [Ascoidea rubescens DSM 1968]ODV59245.1 Phospholipase/carboxylesterase [Ascoidea rubescens DSM 1968]